MFCDDLVYPLTYEGDGKPSVSAFSILRLAHLIQLNELILRLDSHWKTKQREKHDPAFLLEAGLRNRSTGIESNADWR